MTPEGEVKKRVKQILSQFNCYYFMPVQSGYGTKSLDFLCCIKGKFIGIETKAEGKAPTGLQNFIMKQIEDAGGKAFVIDTPAAAEELKEYLVRL